MKSNIVERQHSGITDRFKLIFITEFSFTLYETFKISFSNALCSAKNIKGKDRNAGLNETSHQKTPSFILSVIQTTIER
jgi:hypothetical protein